MWVMTTHGFYSTVRSREGMAMVRGRDRGDLERFLEVTGSDAEILETVGTDYPCRVVVPRETWAAFLRSEAEAIDYRNFKDAVTAAQGRGRHDVYMQVWSALKGITRLAPRSADRTGGGSGTDA
jgi:hypothetical protein